MPTTQDLQRRVELHIFDQRTVATAGISASILAPVQFMLAGAYYFRLPSTACQCRPNTGCHVDLFVSVLAETRAGFRCSVPEDSSFELTSTSSEEIVPEGFAFELISVSISGNIMPTFGDVPRIRRSHRVTSTPSINPGMTSGEFQF